MAVYTEDVQTWAIGSQFPSNGWNSGGWYSPTSSGVSADVNYWGDRYAYFGHAASSWYSYYKSDQLDTDADRADADVVVGMDVPNSDAGEDRPFMIIVRGSGIHNTETCYYVTTTTGVFSIRKLLNGADSELVSCVDCDLDSSTLPGWKYFRFRANGTSLKARWWPYGTPEPSTWDLEVIDADITAPGNIGLGSWNWRSPPVKFAYFSTGTDGDSAEVFEKARNYHAMLPSGVQNYHVQIPAGVSNYHVKVP